MLPASVVSRKNVAYVCVLVGPLADARGSVFSTRFRATSVSEWS